MTSPTSQPRTPRLYHASSGGTFSALGAIALVFAAMASLIVTGVALHLAGAELIVAMAVGQLALLAVAVVAARVTGRNLGALGLRRPAGWYVVAALLVGSSAWYVNLRIVELLPFREHAISGLQQVVDRPALPLVLLTVALAPAICEEVLFRGVLARGLATRFHPWVAILGSAVVFSLYHMQPLQMLPTLTLGIAFALIAYRSGSAIPTMFAHFLNNTLALLVARGELPGFASWLGRHDVIALVIALAACWLGIAIALVRPSVDELVRARVAPIKEARPGR
ncbi:MAG TPA: CPBP family intramembrane glutamic endopeptidase [Kofleriaceae bacterium]|nr:CPBP family intramembrane glutamic endopeptidase [Kofleriaceae bacterium]